MALKFKIAIAPDSFKGSMSALQAARCIEKGLRSALSGIAVRKIPMADGGEGTVDAIVAATRGRTVERGVADPLGRKINAVFGLSGDGRTAVIEMAAASGLALLRPGERDPMITSTYGTGMLIKAALDLGVKRVLVGIGGSATNDGGTGMARALGVKFLDGKGNPLPEGGGALKDLCRIDRGGLDARIRDVQVQVACDVRNPLVGPTGASQVYGPQKGARPRGAKMLDRALQRFAEVVKKEVGMDLAQVPGAGAAGGLGAGLMAFAGAELRSGVDVVMDCVRLRQRLRGSHLVIVGEGRLDGQTVFGKTPSGVARVARDLGIPVIAIAGCVGDRSGLQSMGIAACFSALQEPVKECDLAQRGPLMLEQCASQVGSLIGLTSLWRPDVEYLLRKQST